MDYFVNSTPQTNLMRISLLVYICLSTLIFFHPQKASCQSIIDSLEQVVSSTSDDVAKTEALVKLSSLLLKQDGDKALEYGLQAYALIDTLKRSEQQAHLYRNIGFAYESKSQFEQAESFFSRSLSISTQFGLDTLTAICFHRLGQLSFRMGQHTDALTLLDSAIRIHQRLHNKERLAAAYNLKGRIHYSTAEFPEALDHFQRYMHVSEELENYAAVAKANMNIGLVYRNSNDPVNALTYLEQSLAYSEKVNDEVAIAQVLINMSGLPTAVVDADERLAFLVRASQLLEGQPKKSNYLAPISINIANIYLEKKNFDSALEFAQKGLSNLKGQEESTHYVVGLMKAAEALVGKGRIHDGIAQYKEGLNTATKRGLIKHQAATHRALSDAYELLRDYKNSIYYFKQYATLSDSVVNESKLYEITETRLKYEFAKEQLADSLQYVQELKTQQLEIDKKKNQQRWFIVGLTLLALLLAALYYAYSVKSRANELIAKEKEAANLQKEQAEKQRERAEQSELKLQELDKAKTRLYTNITHEFRTPLTVMLGIGRQFINKPKQISQDSLSMIVRNGENLLTLVNQMLDLSKLESGSIRLNQIQDDIIFYLKYLVESVHSLAETKNLTIDFVSDKSELIMDFDPERIKQILFNLLSNAVKFTPERGDIEVILNHTNSNNEELLIINVTNTGQAIPPDQLTHIFNRFYQIDNSATRTAAGTGIGLALVKELVELKGGTIEATSIKDQKTTFKVVLPVSRKAALQPSPATLSNLELDVLPQHAGSSQADRKSAAVQKVSNEQGKPNLLIIEDNEDVVKYLVSCLQEDYHIMVGTDGHAGIDIAIEQTPDLIITDVMMPKKDGFEVCSTLKQDLRTSHIPIIMLTAKADMASKLDGLQHGADAYLTKPFHQAELVIRSKKLLENRKKLQEYYLVSLGASVQATELINESETKIIEDPFGHQLKSIVVSHISDIDFTVEQLCKEIGMSHSQLHRKITALTGISPIKFIRQVRLNHAKKLLKNKAITIAEVAYQSGFNDPAYFSRVFKKAFSKTPVAWQKDAH